MPIYGVDVHDGYQAGISFPLLYQQGYRFAAVKLTEGTGYVRDAGADWIRAVRAAGMIPGAYHWLTASDGAAQARWFHQHVVAAGGPDGMLIQLDAEADGLGPQISAWVAEWRRLTGWYPFLIYSGSWWWPRTGGFNGSLMTPHLWDSRYLAADADTMPDDPAGFAARIPASWWVPGYGGWARSTILQFTSRGDAGGLGNNVDLNVFPGSIDELRANLTRGGTVADSVDGINTLADVILGVAIGATAAGPITGNTGNHVWKNGTNLASIRVDLASVSTKLDRILANQASDPGVPMTPEDLTAFKAALAEEEQKGRDAIAAQLAAALAALPAAVQDEAAKRLQD